MTPVAAYALHTVIAVACGYCAGEQYQRRAPSWAGAWLMLALINVGEAVLAW